MPVTEKTAGQRAATEVVALLKARNALLWIVSPEEKRVESALAEAAARVRMVARFHDFKYGLYDAAGKRLSDNADYNVQLEALRTNDKDPVLLVMRDLQVWFRADPVLVRTLRSLARSFPMEDCPRAVVILSVSREVPPELQDHAVVVEWPLPDRQEISSVLDAALSCFKTEEARQKALVSSDRDTAVDAAVGLTAEAAATCFAKSIVTQGGKIVSSEVAAEKRRVISKEKGLEWYDPDPRGLAAVGGLDLLKTWLASRKLAFSQRAREFGLPLPKGCLLIGVPGCGKSLTAKTVAAAWQVPLIRIDLGAMRSKWVGDSEAAIRSSLKVVDAVGNCVLWLDEVEKALGGASQGAADGGVSADALGQILTWMNDRKGGAFIVATSNDVRLLPPELLRRGRFDEIFWVDLPNKREREEILRVSLRAHKRDPGTVDVKKIAAACENFSGSEIYDLVPDALFRAFADGERALTTGDLAASSMDVVPLFKSAGERLKGLRDWAKERARPASSPEETETPSGSSGRRLDLEAN